MLSVIVLLLLVAVTISVHNQAPCPTQPTILNGTRNEYRPKCDDSLWVGSKGRIGHSICGCTCWWQVKLCVLSLTRAIPEHIGVIVCLKRFTNVYITAAV